MDILSVLFRWRRDQRESRQEGRDLRREQREFARDLLELTDKAVQAYEDLVKAESDEARRLHYQDELNRRLVLRAGVIDQVLGSHPALPTGGLLQQGRETNAPPWPQLVAVAAGLLDRGQHAAALDVLALADELHPAPSHAVARHRARALEHMGRLDEAVAEFDRVESPPKSRRSAQLEKARMLAMNDRTDEARVIAQPLLAEDEDDEALVTMATINAWEGETDRALELTEKAASLRSGDAGLLSVELHFAEMGGSQQAEQIAKRLLELEPDQRHGLAAMARVNLRIGQPERSLECAQKIVQRQPECVEGHVLAADAYQALNRYDDAIAELRLAERIDPENPQLAFMRAGAVLRKSPDEYESRQHQYRAMMSALSATIEHPFVRTSLRAQALVVRGIIGLVFDADGASSLDLREAEQMGLPEDLKQTVIQGIEKMTAIMQEATSKYSGTSG